MNKLNAKKPNPLYRVLALVMVGVWIGMMPASAHALDVDSQREALKHLFPGVKKVVKKKFWLSDRQRRAIAKLAQQTLPEKRINVYVGMKGGSPVGYAIFESVKNRSWPIHYVTVLNQDGSVKNVEVLQYEGARGWAVRYGNWLKQWPGKTMESDFTPSAMTGATISARTIAQGVKKAVAVYKVLFLDKVK